jgi:hypothetical protein
MRQFFRMYSWISALIQVWVEALDGLHQADIAFLDQVAVRQAVAQVLARHRHDQAQVRQHQAAGGFDIRLVAQAPGEAAFFLLRQHRQAVDGRNVGVQVAERRHQGPRIADLQGGGGGGQVHGVSEWAARPWFQKY